MVSTPRLQFGLLERASFEKTVKDYLPDNVFLDGFTESKTDGFQIESGLKSILDAN